MRLTLTLRNSMGALGEAQARLAEWLETAAVPSRQGHRIELVFEELAANIVMHGYPDVPEDSREFRAEIELAPPGARLALEDDGVAFDPREVEGKRLDEVEGEPQIGGLGLLLVRRFASTIAYRRTPAGRNHLEVAIRLEDAPAAS
ncbi:ATP-binding protein [Paracraurococcus ruber]|uniref:Histidine kinase/HSP90-like ATPase domain-containing protein n=1 Tax=Paracraurococcus ruber TaxID=77675 RepID=A0ABS1D131_9PROT|nr:ATP-binding protein [Paracraurococcus ruber]MBK1660228.1 hypothetical protein [Paracraurococcus ruber]TDG29683.1 ATP-binding protein [Paracraurococcus ruber]